MTKATGQRISAVQASHQQPLVIFLSYFSTNPTHLFGESVDHSWPSSVFFSFFDDDWWCFHFFSASFVHLVSFGQIHSSFHIFPHHMFGFSEAGREACELYLKWEPANSLGSCFERLLCLWKDLGTGHEKGVDSDWLLFWVMFVSGLLICLMQRQMVGWTLRLAWIDGSRIPVGSVMQLQALCPGDHWHAPSETRSGSWVTCPAGASWARCYLGWMYSIEGWDWYAGCLDKPWWRS